ncbi:polysaccharide deacetylase family protein [Candidatus Poribacteria bacterium]|nr:polysaccharide deacetylase family protein [Candidatus Poribacteria bacterium]
MNSPVRVLAYHNVGDTFELGITTVRFRQFWRHLELLTASGFVGVRLDEMARILEQNSPDTRRRIHLTFDDGYECLANGVFADMRRANLGGTVFPIADYVGRRSTWDTTIPRRRHLTWQMLRELSAEGMDIGAHTRTHPFLSRLAPDRARDELASSKARIEDRVGVAVRALAYPYGDWNERLADLARQCGYDLAFTMDPRRPFRRENRWALPRSAVYAIDTLRSLSGKLGLRGDRALRRECAKNVWINRCAYANWVFHG